MGTDGLNGYNSVYEGRDNTGDATVYQDNAPTPVNELANTLTKLHAAKKQQRLEEIRTAADHIKQSGEMDNAKTGAWDIDITREIAPAIAQYHQWYATEKKSGRDPDNPLSPAFAQNREIQANINLRIAASSQHRKNYEDLIKEYNNDKDGKLDRDAGLQQLDQYRQMPLSNRMKANSPMTVPIFNPNTTVEEIIKSTKPNESAYAYESPDGNYYTGKNQTYTPKQITSMAESADADPRYKKGIETRWQNLPADQKKIFNNNIQAFKEDQFQNRNSVQQEAHVASGPSRTEFGQTQKTADELADGILATAGGLRLNNPKIFTESKAATMGTPATIGLNWDAKGTPPEGKQDISNSLVGEKFGYIRVPAGKDGKDTKLQDNIISGWKHVDGKLYVKDTRAQNDKSQYPSGYRPIENMFTEFIMPKVESMNISPAQKTMVLSNIVKKAKAAGYDANHINDYLEKYYSTDYVLPTKNSSGSSSGSSGSSSGGAFIPKKRK